MAILMTASPLKDWQSYQKVKITDLTHYHFLQTTYQSNSVFSNITNAKSDTFGVHTEGLSGNALLIPVRRYPRRS